MDAVASPFVAKALLAAGGAWAIAQADLADYAPALDLVEKVGVVGCGAVMLWFLYQERGRVLKDLARAREKAEAKEEIHKQEVADLRAEHARELTQRDERMETLLRAVLDQLKPDSTP